MPYNFFRNFDCEYFPCHKTNDKENFNCLFCYCPLYENKNCGGNFIFTKNGVKDCTNCTIPHFSYDTIINKLQKKGEPMEITDIYFAKLKDGAIIPSKNEEDAGYDIYAYFDESAIVIKPHETAMIPTGIVSAVNDNYYFQIEERGSTGTKGMGQRCGVIDSGYRGEWFIPITNHNDDRDIIIAKEDYNITDSNAIIYPYKKAVCQAVLLPVPKTVIHEISLEQINAMESKRGTGALGSSKK